MPMDCMDNVNWGNCLWFEGGSEKRNVVSGMLSGLLVSINTPICERLKIS